ncbi:MAG: glycine oxidase ThiO [Blastocatellia bacterium]
MGFSVKSKLLVIGGGVIGLSIARELHKNGGRKITVIDRGIAGQEASIAAAGMLAPNAETDEIGDFYRFCRESGKLYPGFARNLLEETGIDIELDRSGTFYLAFSEKDSNELEKRFKWQKDSGIGVERLSAEEILKAEPFVSPIVRGGLFFPNDWQVENRKLIAALRRYAELNKIELIENTEIEELIVENDRVLGAKAANLTLRAETTVLSAGAWSSLVGFCDLKFAFRVKPIRGQMICFQLPQRPIGHVIYSSRGYIVPRADGRILAGATVEDAGFNKDVTDTAVRSLQKMALEIAPLIANFDIKESWAGLRPFAPDGLPVIGRFDGVEGLRIATGHYRNGILLAPITARIISDSILNEKHSKYLELFSPDRFTKEQFAAKM